MKRLASVLAIAVGITAVLGAAPKFTSVWKNPAARDRSEEHTSELQSLRHLVCRLLLEKKKIQQQRDRVDAVFASLRVAAAARAWRAMDGQQFKPTVVWRNSA